MPNAASVVSQAIRGYAALKPGQKLEPFEYRPGPLEGRDVEIDVHACGLCYSDVSMLKNEWSMTVYPFIPGHEVTGTVAAAGPEVTTLRPGQKVGLGWVARSCLKCSECMSGDHNLCGKSEGVIEGRHGGFADKVRAGEEWAIPLPDEMDMDSAGPLFCGGVTVFNPLIQNALSPAAHAAVIGIGGLGHMALQFLKAWGCEITAFSSSPEKEEKARRLGAHHFVNSRDSEALKGQAGRFDLILNTVNAELDWDGFIHALKPRGKFHFVGAAEAMKITVFPLIVGQKSILGSPVGSPETIRKMLDFAVRHGIRPEIQPFAMSQVNEAIEALEREKPAHRLVLKN